MHDCRLDTWQHSHSFGQERRRPGEARTIAVIALNTSMMVVEILAGLAFGSMALLADGLHMGSHTAAMGLSVFAYVYARRYAGNPRFSFGTGKMNALGGFTGALLLGMFAFAMLAGSAYRLLYPVAIAYDQALLVALAGLLVNGLATAMLRGRDHEHGDGPGQRTHVHDPAHEDLNLRAVYLHVLTDALTSVLAIGGLLAAKYLGVPWVDPIIGLLGAALVARWSYGLLRASSAVLLDRQAPAAIRERISSGIESIADSRVSDLHVWSIGPGIHAAIVTLVTHAPRPLADYRAAIPGELGVVHATIEIEICPAADVGGDAPPADLCASAGPSRAA